MNTTTPITDTISQGATAPQPQAATELQTYMQRRRTELESAIPALYKQKLAETAGRPIGVTRLFEAIGFETGTSRDTVREILTAQGLYAKRPYTRAKGRRAKRG